ncbi:hypothetical protein EI94DRAFT_199771 [Lactarius quietus]|nr:hypothetical protein EI94DRAFT_199771 [Lactarius quietus]
MGNCSSLCISSRATSESVDEIEISSQAQASTVTEVARSPSRRSITQPARESPQTGGASWYERPRVSSAPQKYHRKPSAEHSRASPRRLTMAYSACRTLTSTVRQVLPEHFKFRILVLGKSHSGKSSLVRTVFKVDMTVRFHAGVFIRHLHHYAMDKAAPGSADINVEFRPEDNRYLIVHESSGLDSPASGSQDLQTIRDFISRRTHLSCSPLERLHAIWICVQLSDAIDGNLGDGAEEILGMGNVPVILVFTKFDVIVSRVLFDTAGGDAQQYERARASAYTILFKFLTIQDL